MNASFSSNNDWTNSITIVFRVDTFSTVCKFHFTIMYDILL